MNALTRFLFVPLFTLSTVGASAASFFTQPDPTNEEQYLLERINTARANPATEGQMLANATDTDICQYYAYYSVDRNKLVTDFASYAAKPPLAFNAKLMAAARVQSLDQATRGFQGHDGSDGSSMKDRINGQAYDWNALGENVFAYVQNPFFAHVGLNADWGVPMLDHRYNIMNFDPSFPTYKEIGISYVSTSQPSIGPFVVTEDFGTPADSTESFLVGVVYNDADGSGSYDVGEGMAGVTISTDSGDFYTTTTASGGYVLPLPAGSGTLTVTALGGSLGAPRTMTVQYGNATNVKADFTLGQAASGPALPTVKIKASVTNVTPGGAASSIKISRTGDSSQDLQVTLGVSGTAVQGVDCTALPTSVTIPAGSKSIEIPVQATAKASTNSVSDANTASKRIKIKLQNGAGYLVSSNALQAKAAVKIWN